MTNKDRAEILERYRRVESEVKDALNTYDEASKNHSTRGTGGWVNQSKAIRTAPNSRRSEKMEVA